MGSLNRSLPDAVILCGGQGSRMGGADKGLVDYQGQPLYQHLQAQLPAQAFGQVWLSANRHHRQYACSGLPVLADQRTGYPGPLAGIEAALLASQADWLLVVPCDTPALPPDLLVRLWAARQQAPIVRALAAGRVQPLHCLLNRSVMPALQQALDAGQQAVMRWQNDVGVADVCFDAAIPNLNTLNALNHETCLV
ncbi:molybdenum cofactor guanylyltransferase MobA [Chitinimonas sp. BJYL2]|uniref:molybdenum cofactor guanylyltransferase MobA n=1 Tax=Chitinimonas sp. BJYL2 TaxID=2976696 RepID=UPI0022B5A04E|nr:molybdenum cofactor guanylyltransferase MobA [Chitinimonas sp. BJYL2]